MFTLVCIMGHESELDDSLFLGIFIRSLNSVSEFLDCVISEAFRSMVVHHANGLHERVANGRPNESEASSSKLLAHNLRLSRGRRNLAERVELVPDWSAADKSPDVIVEGTEFFPGCQELFRVRDRRFDFETITYDPGIAKETFDILVLVKGNFRRVEAVECLAIIFTFVQYRLPC